MRLVKGRKRTEEICYFGVFLISANSSILSPKA